MSREWFRFFNYVYEQLNNTTYAQDSADVSYDEGGTGAVTRSVESKLQESVSVKDFGAVGDGVTDDTAAIQAAINSVQSLSGGHLYIPEGTYKLSSTLNMTPQNCVIEGSGQNSVLNFAACTSGAGIAINGPTVRFELCRFTVTNAFASGISLNYGATISSTNGVSRVNIHDIIINGSGLHGLEMTNTYMAKFYDIESINNAGDGFHLNGNHTSLSFNRCWAGGDSAYPNGGNQGRGWFINGVIYSTFEACAADWNQETGWSIYNTCATNFLNCGSESNNKEGFFVGTGSTYRTGVNVPDIYGVSFNGCFGFNNSQATVNLFANLIGVQTANSYPASIDIENCYSLHTGSTSYAVVLNGASGQITTREAMNFYNGYSTFVLGSVFRNNTYMQGRSIIATLSTAQSIANNTPTTAAINAQFTNTMAATIVSNSIIIPETTTKIVVTANASWDISATGTRTIAIFKNGAAITGGGSSIVNSAGYTIQNITSAMLQVVTGDAISLQVTQTSGGALNLLNTSDTFLSVESVA
jgi:hypothetical protein